jgi:hypothetical protein
MLAMPKSFAPASTGVVLGGALLTKAYYLTSLAAVLSLSLLKFVKERTIRKLRDAGFLVGTAVCLSGTWYASIYITTGSISGEQHDVATSGMSRLEIARIATEVKWFEAADSTFTSHIWFGAWSFLKVRSWMYRVMLLLFVLSAFGFLVALIRRRPIPQSGTVVSLFALLVFFIAGLGYHVVTTYAVHGISATTGWYIYALIVPEIGLLLLGLCLLVNSSRPARLSALIAVPWFGIEAFGLHFYQMPYYAGLIDHSSGRLPAFDVGRYVGTDAGLLLERLVSVSGATMGTSFLLALWIAYWVANLCCIWILAQRGHDESSGI